VERRAELSVLERPCRANHSRTRDGTHREALTANRCAVQMFTAAGFWVARGPEIKLLLIPERILKQISADSLDVQI
jgi:hypothetical protein